MKSTQYRSTPWLLLFSGVIGLIAAFTLTQDKIAILSDPSYIPSCNINPVLSCGSVIITEQASVFGFPNPIIGLISFSVVITLAVLLISRVVLPGWVWLGLNLGALGGMAFACWLIFQSLYVIDALCPWCMVVWAVTAPIAIWVTAANLASGRIPAPDSWQTSLEAIAGLRVFVLAGWYLTVLGLIFLRWQDFWTNSI